MTDGFDGSPDVYMPYASKTFMAAYRKDSNYDGNGDSDESDAEVEDLHITPNGSRLRIRVPEDIVINISGCFARARMLNLDLARRTESFFVEWPNRLLTVAVPTDFQV